MARPKATETKPTPKPKEKITTSQDTVSTQIEETAAPTLQKVSVADFLASEGVLFYGTPVPLTEEKLHDLLTKYACL